MKRNWNKRMLSALLTVLMVFLMLPFGIIPASAADMNGQRVSYTGGIPNVHYDLSYTKSRPNNSQMTYTFTVRASLGSASSWVGTGYIFTGVFTVNGVSGAVSIRQNGDSWNGVGPHSTRSVTITVPSSSGNASQSASFRVNVSNYNGNSFGAVSKDFTVTSSPMLASTVTYNANGGSVSPTSATVSSGSATTLPTPTRTGYTCTGWYTASSGGGKAGNAGASYTVSSNTTLYAQWAANTYTATFDKQSGAGGSNSVVVTYNANMPSAAMPTRAGYGFSGYYDATSGGTQYYTSTGASARTWNKTSSATLYARWTANAYSIALDKQGGLGGSANIIVTFSANMPLTSIPTRTGYTFAGYYDAASGGTQYYNAAGVPVRTWNKANGATLYAQWIANTYPVTLDRQGGTSGSASVTATYDANMPSMGVIPTRTGYTFAGYYDAASGGTQYYTATGASARTWNKANAATLYARWTANTNTQYRVERYYQNADGSYPANPSAAINYYDGISAASKTITAPSITNYTYDGTVTGSTGLTLTINASGTTVYKLYYRRNTVSLVVNTNGGTGGTASQTGLRWGQQITLATPTRAAYNFTGWTVSGTGASIVGNTLTMGTANTTVTANWVQAGEQYRIETYCQNADGTYPAAPTNAETSYETANTSKTITPPSIANYAYDGTVSGSTGLTLTINSAGTTVFRLYYKRSMFDLAVDANGGTGGSGSQTGLRWGATFTLTPPTRQGYTFSNWSVSGAGASVYGNVVTIGTEATTVTANWTANTNTAYKVEQYYQAANGTYPSTASAAANYTDGTTAANRTITAPDVANYTYDSTASGSTGLTMTINAAGTTVFKLYYRRNVFKLTVNVNGGTGGSGDQAGLPWGSAFTLTPPARQGYTFLRWDVSGTGASISGNVVTIGTEATAITANWTANTDTQYRVDRYYQEADGTYPADASVTDTYSDGTTAASKTVTAPAVANYAYDDTIAGSTPLTLLIAADGSTVFNLYYKRSTFHLTIDKNGGAGGSDDQTGLRWGDQLTLTAPTRTGYSLTGWQVIGGAGAEVNSDIVTMGIGSTSIRAIWTANIYTVTFNPDGGTLDSADSNTMSVTYAGTYGAGSEFPTPTRKGYAFDGWYIAADGGGSKILTTTPVAITADQTLFANWLPNKTITGPFTGPDGSTVNAIAESEPSETFDSLSVRFIASNSRQGFPDEVQDEVNPLFEAALLRSGTQVDPAKAVTVRLPFTRGGSSAVGQEIMVLHFDRQKNQMDSIVAVTMRIGNMTYLEFTVEQLGFFQPKYSLAFYDNKVYQQAKESGVGSSPDPLLAIQMNSNESYQLRVADGLAGYTWQSNSPSLVSLAPLDGVIGEAYTLTTGQPAAETKVSIRVTDQNDVIGICTLTILPQSAIVPTGVSLDKTSATILNGTTAQLTASVTPGNATNKAVIWKSSNIGVALVDSKGLITSVGLGTATITATTISGDREAACTVTVIDEVSPTSVSLNQTSATLMVGGSLQLSATVNPSNATNKNVTWSSSNTSVVSVTATGLVNAASIGTATITVRTERGDRTAACTITVRTNTSTLNGRITELEALRNNNSYTEASWNAFQNALQAARSVRDNQNATQGQVNDALTALNAAYSALLPRAETTALNRRITDMEAIANNNYTQESWNAFQNALQTARSVRDNPNATQGQVNDALSALNAAYNGLQQNPTPKIRLWGRETGYESNLFNWLLCIVCFGWIWMAF